MTYVDTTALRTSFAARLSALYGREVPAYRTLVEVSRRVNTQVLAREGADAERLGSIQRVTAERHGAIRVGSARELRDVASIFAALGMEPTGFYDLRDAHPQPVPVVSTAFRPIAPDELAANPFRVFTSVLVPEDRRFFDADLADRLHRFVAARTLFPAELLALASRAEAGAGLPADDAERFLDLAAAAFALSPEPVDRAWYDELGRVSGVAADIGGVASTHLNHLTPRVLNIDDLYHRMSALGIEMIDQIQGPPRWDGPDVLLRQTSFRALAEPRTFRETDGSLSEGALRVRFGEVESRGIALSPAGRERYEQLMAEAAAAAPDVWRQRLPATERGLWQEGLAFFTYTLEGPAVGTAGLSLSGLVERGHVRLEPIVYEDFLPRSAAGIFESNLSDRGTVDGSAGGAPRDADWVADAIGRAVHVPEELYAAQSRASLVALESSLGTTLEA